MSKLSPARMLLLALVFLAFGAPLAAQAAVPTPSPPAEGAAPLPEPAPTPSLLPVDYPRVARPGDPLFLWSAPAFLPPGAKVELLSPKGRVLAQAMVFLLEPGISGVVLGLPVEAGAGEHRLVLRPPASSTGAPTPPTAPLPAAPAAPDPTSAAPQDSPPPAAPPLVAASAAPSWPASGLPLIVEARAFPTEDIPLNAANTAIRTAPDPKKEEEARILFALYAKADPGALHLAGALSPPVAGRRSSGFGDRRRYLYATGGTDSTYHLGLDYAVPVGTPVLAPAPGRVVFAQARIVTGLTLVLEHLPGLYSVYLHLSEFVARPGDLVAAGQVLAKSGNTGLSTGPHLHFELRAAGIAVDPDWLLARGPVDKARLLAIMAPAIEGR